jgi:hypothetical protein
LFRETWTVLVLVLQVVSDKKGGQPEEEERRGPRPSRRVSGGLFALHRFGQAQHAIRVSMCDQQLLIQFCISIQEERTDGWKEQQQHSSAGAGSQVVQIIGGCIQ